MLRKTQLNKMKIEQNTISRDWTVLHKGRRFFVNLTESDGQTLALCDRDKWQIHVGGSETDHASSVQQTSDAGYVVAGTTYSFGEGGADAYLIKYYGPDGNCEDCFPSDPAYADQHADWEAFGRPDCWCGPPLGSGYQCDGDADGKTEGLFTKWRVSLKDLDIIIANWKKKMGDNPNPCADIDHKYQGAITKYRVSLNDLNIIISNWKKRDHELPGNCPRPE